MVEPNAAAESVCDKTLRHFVQRENQSFSKWYSVVDKTTHGQIPGYK